MDGLAGELGEYSYFHAARAALLAELDRRSEAVAAYERAIDESGNEAEIRWMRRRRAELDAELR